MKVRVILQTNNVSMNQVLPFGFETEIETITQEHDHTVSKSHRTKEGGWQVYHEVVWKKGDYKDYRFKGFNGNMYDSHFIYCAIGHKPLKEIFEKID